MSAIPAFEVVQSVALAIPRPQEVTSARELCESIELALPNVDDPVALLEGRAKLLAVESYLARTTKVGKARMEATARRIEMRVGEVLGEALPNGGNSRNGSPVGDPLVNLRKQEVNKLRLLAAHRDITERVIANADDTAPASRRKVLEAIRIHLAQQKEPNVNKREAVKDMAALGMTGQQIADDLGCTLTRVWAIAREESIALPGNQLARDGRSGVISEMAQAGHNSSQIGKKLGISSQHVRSEARRLDIEIQADAVLGRGRLVNPVRVISETVAELEASAASLSLIENPADHDLDRTQLNDWVISLEQSLRALTRFKNQLKEMTQ